jgi:L-fucose isomerase-like protein
MKKFGFIPIASEITPVAVEEIAADIQNELKKTGGIKLTSAEINNPLPVVYLILTGGTEQKLWNLYSERKKTFKREPVLLLAHKSNNSLPASLEILAKLKQEGVQGRIIFIEDCLVQKDLDEIFGFLSQIEVYHKLKNTVIGLIGSPSDWLIASSPNTDIVENNWGPVVKKIDISELMSLTSAVDVYDENILYESFAGKAESINGPSADSIKFAFKPYLALQKITDKYNLNAVSVRCFDLVLDLNTTGCYALSKLNDDGIIAGCEGDIISTLGMVWLNYFTGKQVWMANPARLDEKNNSIWLAHCTVPTKMIEKFRIRTHFESGLGVGIQGDFSNQDVTLLRIGGKNLEKIWIAEGEIIEAGNDDNLCRTQVHIKLKGDAKPSDLLNNPLGNHLLMVQGSYLRDLIHW